ncbi:MAG TPA: class I SAM-dependent methyltransferase [Bacteroidia bacterium]|nr:class I SAM-dependent methyltransferase [Bacteroidia bacterium]
MNKYDVNYHQCSSCSFVQTDDPFWLSEAYQSAITSLDIGLINRNIYLQKEIPKIIESCFPDAKIMLDYGGGYGMFVRMMRDLGYNFYRQDSYCENLFAKYFDIVDIETKRMDVLTTFEVFEHLDNPLEEIKKMFDLSDNIVFSTVLTPADINEFTNWWYVSPLVGQHIAFYDITTLKYLAGKFGKHLYSNGNNLHVFSSKKLDSNIVNRAFGLTEKTMLQKIAARILNRMEPNKPQQSLLEKDYLFIEQKLINKN